MAWFYLPASYEADDISQMDLDEGSTKMGRPAPRWRIWLIESRRELGLSLVVTAVVLLIAIFMFRQELRLSEMLLVIATFSLVPPLLFVLGFLSRALDDRVDAASKKFPQYRRAGALLIIPAAAAFGHGAVSQWSTDPVRASLAALCCIGFLWIAAMVALNRTWSGTRRP